MATTTTKPDIEMAESLTGINLPAWPNAQPADSRQFSSHPEQDPSQKPSQRDALHALLAFSALHDQVRRRRALATQQAAFDSTAPVLEFEPTELFILDEVLQLVAERAVAITGADGLAVALAENNEIVLRAAARGSTATLHFPEPASAPPRSSTATTPRPIRASIWRRAGNWARAPWSRSRFADGAVSLACWKLFRPGLSRSTKSIFAI
jgi:hypothetical protein